MENTQNIQQWLAAEGISSEVIFTGDSHQCPTCRDAAQLAA